MLRLSFDATGAPLGADLAAQSSADLQIIEPAPSETQIPFSTVAGVRSRQPIHMVGLRGSVLRGANGLIFQDSSGKLPLKPKAERDIPLGEEKIGAFAEKENGTVILTEGSVVDEGGKVQSHQALTNVAEIQRLSATELSRSREVLLEGVVTYSDPSVRDTFIQDETGGIFVFAPTGASWS